MRKLIRVVRIRKAKTPHSSEITVDYNYYRICQMIDCPILRPKKLILTPLECFFKKIILAPVDDQIKKENFKSVWVDRMLI